MTSAMKGLLIVLGLLTAVFILAQIVMGQLILGGRADLIKAHQHSGYTAVVLALAYVAFSMRVLLSIPTREGKGG
jgi:hypothetical protein